MTKKILGKECRFAVYIPPAEHGGDDYHLIKEITHYEGNESSSDVKLVKNMKRPFWVTKKGFQNHESKKEWEKQEHLIKFETTESQMNESIAKAMNKRWLAGDKRKLFSEPYLYGADILSTSIIKQMYLDKYKEIRTYSTVAVYDVETDVVIGHGEINIASVTMKDKCYTWVTKEYVEGIGNVHYQVDEMMNKYLGKYVTDRNLKCELHIVDNAIEIVKQSFLKLHEIKPDFLEFWNMDFDISRILDACTAYNVDPKDIFSDPIVPVQNRFFRYKQGKKQKVTASGVVTPIKPADRWHTVFAPSSFYCIDGMCVYKKVRQGKQEEPSYRLDSILDKELGVRKLNFTEADHIKIKLKWHQYMQTNYKLQYIIYNRFDCISVELLDEKTLDVCATLSEFSGCSDYELFSSLPKRAAERLHFYVMNKGLIIGTSGKSLVEDLDEETMKLSGWISNLAAELVLVSNTTLIEETDAIRSLIFSWVGDLDIGSSLSYSILLEFFGIALLVSNN